MPDYINGWSFPKYLNPERGTELDVSLAFVLVFVARFLLSWPFAPEHSGPSDLHLPWCALLFLEVCAEKMCVVCAEKMCVVCGGGSHVR